MRVASTFRKAEALLFGLALGDALAANQSVQELPDPARYGDDTREALALAETLLDAGSNQPPAKRAACATVIGWFYRDDERRLREAAQTIGQNTHDQAASAAAAYAVKLALDDVPPVEYLRRVLTFTDGISDEFDAAIYRIGHVGAWADEQAALDHIGRGDAAAEAVALALYCVIRSPDDCAACVRRAATTNGGAAACIAGGIMGARLGLEAIPLGWRGRIEKQDYIHDLAERMAQAAQR